MAYTKKDKAYQKKRYRTDTAYREKLIKDNTEKHKKHKKKYAKIMKDYYNSNSEYRRKKIAKMRVYNQKKRKDKKSKKY